jgi:hypothetical protein
MFGLFLRMARVAVLAAAVLVATATGGFAAQVTLGVDRSDPGLSSVLARNRPLYIAIRYQSDVPIRLQAHALYRGVPSPGAEVDNPSGLFPAGSGTALVAISFRTSARVDSIAIAAHDADGRMVTSDRVVASLRWTDEVLGRSSEPSWVARLKAQQEALFASRDSGAAGSPWASLPSVPNLAALAALPLYLLLLPLAWWRLAGGRRKAAFVPLLVVIPAAFYAWLTLGAGSSLTTIGAALAIPLAVLYLAGLLILPRPVVPARS